MDSLISKISYYINYASISVNLYWFLFLIPGFAFLLYLKKKGKIQSFFLESVFLSFTFSFLSLIPIILIAYAFRLNILYVSYFYISELVIGLIYVALNLNIKNLKSYLSRLTYLDWALIVVILFDLALTNFVGNYFHPEGDTWVHLAKMAKSLDNGVNILEPFMKVNVALSNYHYNALHIILALPAKILKVELIDSWRFTLPFFRVVAFSSLYFLVNNFFKNAKLAAFSVAGAIVIFSNGSFAFANYPFAVAYLWFALYFVSFMKFIESKKIDIYYFLLLASSVLLTFTHPSYALIGFCFTFYVTLLLIIFKQLKWSELKFLVPLPLILSIAPLYSFTFPKNMTLQSINYGLDVNYHLIHFGPLYILKPDFGILFIYLLTLVGVAISFIWIKDNKKRIILIAAYSFSAMIFYNPIVLPVLNKFIPVWLIMRFRGMDVFLLALPMVPFFLLADYFFKKEGKEKLLFLGVLSYVILLSGLSQTPGFLAGRTDNKYGYSWAKEITSFKKDIKPGEVVASNISNSYLIPSVLNNYVISLPEDHANPAINLSERKKDLYNLFQNKETSKKEKEYLLKKYDSKYLLVFNWELKDFEGVSNLNTIRQDGQMTLFEVTN